MSELTDRDLASDLYRDARLMDECGYLHIGTVMRRAAKRLEDHHNARAKYKALMALPAALERSREWAWSDFEGSIEQFEEHPEVKAIDSALAALRAAGIDMGDEVEALNRERDELEAERDRLRDLVECKDCMEYAHRVAAAIEAATIERCAKVVDQCNREGPYNAIGAASRIRALKAKP